MQPKPDALDAFLARKTDIDTALKRLQALSNDHFHADPDEIHWGHVGDLERYAEHLKHITDIAFREGEYAN